MEMKVFLFSNQASYSACHSARIFFFNGDKQRQQRGPLWQPENGQNQTDSRI